MPRPARVREREATRAVADPPENANEALDGAAELEQPSRSGSVEDEDPEEFAKSIARDAGWNEERERNGRPIKDWQDHRTYLKELPRVLREKDERLRRTGQVAEAAAEEARRTALREAENRLSGAIDTGDKDAARAAATDMARNSGPHPATVAWVARNNWFTANGHQGDDEATALAVAAITRAERAGKSVADALDAGEAAVRQRFPEHFDAPARREERRNDPPPPAVVGGGRAGTGAKPTKERGWADIPSQDRAQMQQFVKKAERRGQTAAASQAFLATAYWKEKA